MKYKCESLLDALQQCQSVTPLRSAQFPHTRAKYANRNPETLSQGKLPLPTPPSRGSVRDTGWQEPGFSLPQMVLSLSHSVTGRGRSPQKNTLHAGHSVSRPET